MRRAVYGLLAARKDRAGYVFARRGWDSYRSAFETIAAKITTAPEGKLLTFHGFRHHFASWFMMNGGRLEALLRILGHATLTMTMRYAHLAPEHLRTAVSRLEGLASSQPTSVSAQASTQEPVETVGTFRK